MMYLKALEKLDQYQKAVVSLEQNDRSVLCTEAAAGSGKTSTMVVKAQKHIDLGTPPEKVLMTTFSKNSVIDMRHKYKKTFPQQIVQPEITTLHSKSLQFLRQFFPEFREYKIITSGYGIMKMVLEENGFLDEDVLEIQFHAPYIYALLDHIEAYQLNNLSSPYDLDETNDIFTVVKEPSGLFELSEFYEILDLYIQKKHELQVLTFGDMIYELYWQLDMNPEVLIEVQKTFDVFILDEAQDNTPLIFDMISLLCKTHPTVKLTLVYDEVQKIYAFMYASNDGLTKIKRGEVLADVTILPLLMNYRSDANIVKAGNILRRYVGKQESIPFNANTRSDAITFKSCYVNLVEGETVVETIKSLLQEGYSYKDISIIIRTNKVIKEIIEPALIKSDIPYRMNNDSTGAKLLDRELSDFYFNALSLISDSDDKLAMIACLSLVFGDLYQKDIRELAKCFQSRANEPLSDLINQHCEGVSYIVAGTMRKIYNDLINIVNSDVTVEITLSACSLILRDALSTSPNESRILKDDLTVQTSINNLVYQIAYEGKEAKKELGYHDLIKIALSITENYDKEVVEDAVTIGSIHSFKGQEGKVSICAGFTNGKEVKDVDQDHLQKLYVQVTRAQEKLILINSLSWVALGKTDDLFKEVKYKDGILLPEFKHYRQNCKNLGICRISGVRF